MRATWWWCVVLAAIAAGCSRGPPRRAWVIVRAEDGVGDPMTWDARTAVRSATRGDDGATTLDVDLAALGASALRVDAPGACTAAIDATKTKDGEELAVTLRARVAIDEPLAQVGYDAPFELRVGPPCGERGAITWRQIEGDPIAPLVTSDDGYVARGRTRPMETRPADLPWGVVPRSPRTRGALAFDATWTGAHGEKVHRVVHVNAAARASGTSSLAVHQRVLLGGSGWRVRDRPRGGAADVTLATDGLATFAGDALGRWVLEDGAGRALPLTVGAFARVPLDCGRSECHAPQAAGVVDSPMTHVLERGVSGAFGEAYSAACAIACHAEGEPGVHDEGFTDVARDLGVALPTAPRHTDGAWARLPRDLRRLGGVGCTACHGPAAIPEKDARWTIFRADVCATCHDAPPRYGHVVAWSASRMARADATPGTRDPECASCHTTAGFLHVLGASTRIELPPEGAPPVGVACAACHAPHERHEGAALLRDAPARLCTGCHAPRGPRETAGREPEPRLARASAADLVAGGAAPHASLACVGCHAESHTFRVDRAVCTKCHASDRPATERVAAGGAPIADRARALWSRLAARGVVPALDPKGPPHATRAGVAASAPPALRAAAADAAMVLEDPAAWAHGGGYARELLDRAERAE